IAHVLSHLQNPANIGTIAVNLPSSGITAATVITSAQVLSSFFDSIDKLPLKKVLPGFLGSIAVANDVRTLKANYDLDGTITKRDALTFTADALSLTATIAITSATLGAFAVPVAVAVA
ncbi:hypothetical protein, partial [Pseudomonas viridiflava]|uniref:hypothetical protein n=1 Tax=Pseudomonas viridiflava TaxID=33069 RepID=UPI0013CF0710